MTTAILVGMLAGAHTSSWGMYKDAPHEGFTLPKYLRSVVVAALVAAAVYLATGFGPDTWAHAAVFFGIVYTCERLLTEVWKTYLREEDQSKYFIPMQLAVFGKPVRSRMARYAVMVLHLGVVVLLVLGAVRLQQSRPDLPAWVVLLTIGSAGGWISAFGGAWKDAPLEGFETFKFFRSPAIALMWATVMAFFTTQWVFIGAAGIGYTVASIETYKTFFFPSKPRGKFAGKPVLYPEILERRKVVAVLYAGIWAVMLAMLVLGFLGPREGLLP